MTNTLPHSVRRALARCATLLVLAPLAARAQTPARTPATPPASAGDPVTVAVLRFNNGAIGKANAELEPLAFGIPEVLMSELALEKRIRLFERARLDDL